MPKMIILRGVSGSGKSTWAQQQSAIVVSRDAIRAMQYGSDGPDYYDVDKAVLRQREETVTVIQDAMIEASLRAGNDVIVDNTNIEWKYVKALAKIANRVGADVEVKVFDEALNFALANDKFRGNSGGRRVGDEIIRKQHQRLQGTKDKTLEPVFVPAPYEGTPGKPKAFLVDIDGTLAHMRDYRGPFDWAKVDKDDVDSIIADIVNTLTDNYSWTGHPVYTAIVMSGRDESCRDLTQTWLHFHGIQHDHLFMRPANDMRPDNIVKAELFDNYVRDNFDVQFVIDDRRQVVEMWQRMGLKVLNVAGLDGGDF